MNKLKIGIIGKVPPPFGGVTVHVSRLYDYVNSSNLNYKAFLISSFKDLKKFLKSDIIHLHQNNPYKRFCLIILSKLFLNTILYPKTYNNFIIVMIIFLLLSPI